MQRCQGAGEDLVDGGLQPGVGVAGDQLDPDQPRGRPDRAQELGPERLGLGLADIDDRIPRAGRTRARIGVHQALYGNAARLRGPSRPSASTTGTGSGPPTATSGDWHLLTEASHMADLVLGVRRRPGAARPGARPPASDAADVEPPGRRPPGPAPSADAARGSSAGSSLSKARIGSSISPAGCPHRLGRYPLRWATSVRSRSQGRRRLGPDLGLHHLPHHHGPCRPSRISRLLVQDHLLDLAQSSSSRDRPSLAPPSSNRTVKSTIPQRQEWRNHDGNRTAVRFPPDRFPSGQSYATLV